MSLTDEQIIEHALENGWVQIVDERQTFGGRWSGWRYTFDSGGSHGVPVGTFQGPKWCNGVKVHDGPYEITWADAMRDKLDHLDRCDECGKWIEYGYSSVRKPARHCFSCHFWLERVAQVTDGRARYGTLGRPGNTDPFVANSNLGGSKGGPTFFSFGAHGKRPSSHNGFGGSWFVVTFCDGLGTEVETCDLWCGGPVPERFQDRLPVTCELRYGRLVTP